MRPWMMLETGPALIDMAGADAVVLERAANFVATAREDDVIHAEADTAFASTGAGADRYLNNAVTGCLFTGQGDDIAVNRWIMERAWLGSGDDRLINMGQLGEVDAGAGDDLLYFGTTSSGALSIRGGAGADTFFFDAAPATFTIEDFEEGDLIDLSSIEGETEIAFRTTDTGCRYDVLIDGEANGLAVELTGVFEPLPEDAFIF